MALFEQMTGIEWAVVLITVAVCLLGAVLPTLGNLLGRLFLGEDPLLTRWRDARAARKEKAAGVRLARREAKKAKKAQKTVGKLGGRTGGVDPAHADQR